MIRRLPLLPRRGFRLLTAAAGLLLLYAALGFLAIPAVVKARLPGTLSRLLGRAVVVRQVRLNPFTLTASVEGFAVKERDGSDFLGWDRLRMRLGPATLFSRTVAFSTIELVRPFGRVTVERGGRLNYADILERLGGPAPGPSGPPRSLRIDRLSILEAQVKFLDRSLTEPFTTTLGPLSLELTGFSTGPNSRNPYAFDGRTEAGEQFHWTGAFSLDPLASQGSFRIDRLVLPKYHPFYGDQVAFRVLDGTASVRAGYAFQWSEGRHAMKLLDGSLDLLDLKLAQGRTPEVELGRVEARGVEADLIDRSVRIGHLGLRDGRIAVTRDAKGAIDLVAMLTPKSRPSPEPVAPFKLELKELRLQGFRVAFQDLGTARPVHALAEDVALTLKGFSLDPAARAELTLAMKLNGASLGAEGTVAPLRSAFDLAVRIDRLGLPAFDPYLAPATDIRLNRGLLGLDGRMSADPAGHMAFRGTLRLDGFEAADGAKGEPFLSYRRLTLSGLELHTPDSVSIQRIDLLEPSPRLVVAQDGSTNVGRALKFEPASTGKPLSAVGEALPPSQGRPLRLSIHQTRMAAGRLSFIDRSVEPNAALLITGMEGSATSLSTEPDSQAVVDFKGLAGGLAPMRVQGRAMPLRKDQDTDVTVTIQASELTDFSPYAGKFLGYTIRKGKLDLNAHVLIRQRQLEAQLNTRMDQFYLGDKVPSPDAVKAPVKLALAILRDRKGVIDLELPVTGNLDDPDLHYGRIILHAVLNVMVKVAASPFTLLAKLGGAQDHDLSYVTFAAGSAVPDPVAVTKAQALAKALEQRPELSLEAEGCADPAADASALKQQRLEQTLLRLKPGAPGGTLTPEERARCLRVAFVEAFPAVAPTPVPPPAEMEQRLLGTFTVSADDLRQLAADRAKALIGLLLEAKVDPGRLFAVSGGERAAKEGGGRVYFGLK
jgi:uncharacterized protein involved in outer membrane biogenesis